MSVCLAVLYALGLVVDWPGWLRGGVAWKWERQIPLYLSSRFWLLAGLFISWLFLLFLAMRLPERWRRWQTGLFLLAAICLSLFTPLVIASQQRSQPISIAFQRTVHPTAGFYEEGVKLDDPVAFIQAHINRMTGYRGVHLRTQPPGWPVSFWAASQVWQLFPEAADDVAHQLRRTNCAAYDLQGLLPEQVSAAMLQIGILLVAALGIPPLYLLARDVFSHYIARIAVVAYVLLPGLLTFQASFDVLYAVCTLLVLLLARRAYTDGSGWAMILLAVAIAGLTFFAFGPLAMIGLVNVYMLVNAWLWRRSWSGIRPIVSINLVIFGTIALAWLLFWLLWGVSWPEMLRNGLKIHDLVRGTQSYWPIFNYYDLAVFLGIPLFLWAVTAGLVSALRMKRPRPGDSLILSWLFFIIFFNLSGTVKAETGRLWLFLMPVGLIIAVAFLVDTLLTEDGATKPSVSSDLNSNGWPYRPVLFVLVLVVFGIQAIVTGLFLFTPLPTDATPEVVWSLPDTIEPIHYELGDTITLKGYTVREKGDDDLLVTLYWQATDRTRADYSVFVHAINDDGESISQSDGIPMDGDLPTWCWIPGEVVADAHLLSDAQIADETVQIGVGIYDWRNGFRVPVFPPVPDNVIPLQ